MNAELTQRLKTEARRLGFDQVGVAPAVAPPGYPRFQEWLAKGSAAGMGYLERHAEARSHPDHVLDGVRSVVMVSFVYGKGDPPPGPIAPTTGRVARYARGEDYHQVLWRRLESLLAWLQAECPTVRGRAISDTAPLLERDFAQLAGMGWIGKNTMLIDRRLGSYTLLGALLVDIELEPDEPHVTNHCGTCTRCLQACPTDAFAGPYQLDARRCLSYWTIEHKGPIANEFAGQLGDWVFGCDICQEVCPWNRKAPPGKESALAPRPEWTDPDLLEWLTRPPAEFTRSLKGTALSRAKRSGLLRNAALILGTRRATAAVPALTALLNDTDGVIRSSAAWALGRIGTVEAFEALKAHANHSDPVTREAIAHALTGLL